MDHIENYNDSIDDAFAFFNIPKTIVSKHIINKLIKMHPDYQEPKFKYDKNSAMFIKTKKYSNVAIFAHIFYKCALNSSKY